MSNGVVLPTNVTQFPPEVANQAEKDKLDTLGQQISTIVHNYNALKQEIVVDGQEDRKAKFAALLDQRRAAIEACMDAWKAREVQIVGRANRIFPALAGLGDLTSLQTQIATEQTKLAALQAYYTSYKAAVDAGMQPPPLPPELGSDGFMGISTGTLIMLAAGAAALYFFFMKK